MTGLITEISGNFLFLYRIIFAVQFSTLLLPKSNIQILKKSPESAWIGLTRESVYQSNDCKVNALFVFDKLLPAVDQNWFNWIIEIKCWRNSLPHSSFIYPQTPRRGHKRSINFCNSSFCQKIFISFVFHSSCLLLLNLKFSTFSPNEKSPPPSSYSLFWRICLQAIVVSSNFELQRDEFSPSGSGGAFSIGRYLSCAPLTSGSHCWIFCLGFDVLGAFFPALFGVFT